MTPVDEDRLTDYSEDGVDLTLIRCMLALTPAERLQVLQSHLNGILAIRELNAAKWLFGDTSCPTQRGRGVHRRWWLAAVLDGAPINTFDLDVVHARGEANIDRLLAVLEELDAVYRSIRPSVTHLTSAGHQNLITRFGWLDLLGTVGRNLGYDDLLPHSAEMDVGEGVLVWVLDLETLIAIKEELGGDKDRAVLPVLRGTLEEKRKAR